MGAGVVEAVVVGEVEEEDVEKVVVGVETAAFTVVGGNVAVEMHLALAVQVGFAPLLLLLALSPQLSGSPLSVSPPPSPPLSPLSFVLLDCSGVSGESEPSSSLSSSSESCFWGYFGTGLGGASGSVGAPGGFCFVAGFGAGGGLPSWGALGFKAATWLLSPRETSSFLFPPSRLASTRRGSIAAAFGLGERWFEATRSLVCSVMPVEEPTNMSTVVRE